MVSFDYEYYLKIIEFIKNSSEEVHDDINQLIESTLKMRENSFIKVSPFSVDVSEVRIGDVFVFTPEDNKMSFKSPVKLKINQNKIIVDTTNYLDEGIIQKSDKSKYVDFLSKSFLKKDNSNALKLKVVYSGDALDEDKFSTNNVPHFKWFKNNYLTTKDEKINNRISIKNNAKGNALTIGTLLSINSVDLFNKETNVFLDGFCNINDNIFVTNTTLNIDPDSKTPYEMIQVDTDNVGAFNSVVTDNGIKNTLLSKSLDNLTDITIKSYGEQNSVMSIEDYFAYCRNESFTNKNTLKLNTNALMHLFNSFPLIKTHIISDEIFKFVSKDELLKTDIVVFLYKLTGVDFSDMLKIDDDEKKILNEQLKATKKIEGIPASLNLIDFVYYTIIALYSDRNTFSFKKTTSMENSETYYNKNDFMLNYCFSFKNKENYITKEDLTKHFNETVVNTQSSRFF